MKVRTSFITLITLFIVAIICFVIAISATGPLKNVCTFLSGCSISLPFLCFTGLIEIFFIEEDEENDSITKEDHDNGNL